MKHCKCTVQEIADAAPRGDTLYTDYWQSSYAANCEHFCKVCRRRTLGPRMTSIARDTQNCEGADAPS